MGFGGTNKEATAKSTEEMVAWAKLMAIETEGVDKFEINLFPTLLSRVFSHIPQPLHTHTLNPRVLLPRTLFFPASSLPWFFYLNCHFLQEAIPYVLVWGPFPCALITPNLSPVKYSSSLVIVGRGRPVCGGASTSHPSLRDPEPHTQNREVASHPHLTS